MDEHDPERVFAEIARQLAEWRAGIEAGEDSGVARDAAYLRALERDLEDSDLTGYGNLAGLYIGWVTGGWIDRQGFETAWAVLGAPGEHPLWPKVEDVVRRYAAVDLTDEQWSAAIKKPLIRREREKPPAPPTDALPLDRVENTLRSLLDDAGFRTDAPDVESALAGFAELDEGSVDLVGEVTAWMEAVKASAAYKAAERRSALGYTLVHSDI